MKRYVWRDGHFYDRSTGEPMEIPEREGVCMPMVRSDIPEYLSPIDGKPITSNSHRRYDLEANGCVPAEPRKKRGYKNPRFAAKHGLPLNEEGREALERRKKEMA